MATARPMTNEQFNRLLGQLHDELKAANHHYMGACSVRGRRSTVMMCPESARQIQRVKKSKTDESRHTQAEGRHSQRGQRLASQLSGLELYITGRVIARREEHHGGIDGVLGSGQWRTVEYPMEVAVLRRAVTFAFRRSRYIGWEVEGSCKYRGETVYFNPFPNTKYDPAFTLELEVSPEERTARRRQALEREASQCEFIAPDGWRCGFQKDHEPGHVPAHGPKIHSEFCGIFMSSGFCTCVVPAVGTRM